VNGADTTERNTSQDRKKGQRKQAVNPKKQEVSEAKKRKWRPIEAPSSEARQKQQEEATERENRKKGRRQRKKTAQRLM